MFFVMEFDEYAKVLRGLCGFILSGVDREGMIKSNENEVLFSFLYVCHHDILLLLKNILLE